MSMLHIYHLAVANILVHAFAILSTELNNNASAIVAIVGGNGRTGQECVREAKRMNLIPRVLVRSGRYEGTEEGVEAVAADVKNYSSLLEGMRGAKFAVFAATAELTSQSFEAVDFHGAENTARAAVKNGVEFLSLISSMGITQLAFIPGEAKAKVDGEIATRSVMKGSNSKYAILRPGVLTNGPRSQNFPMNLEYSQTDSYFGFISRADTAGVAVGVFFDPEHSHAKTFEFYNKRTRMPSKFLQFQEVPLVSGKKTVGEALAELNPDQ